MDKEDSDEVTFEYMLRWDDNTEAYYCAEERLVINFVDVMVVEAREHFRYWGKYAVRNMLKFLYKYFELRDLHETFHVSGVGSSKQCDYMACLMIFENKRHAEREANWLYPVGDIQEVIVIEGDIESDKKKS